MLHNASSKCLLKNITKGQIMTLTAISAAASTANIVLRDDERVYCSLSKTSTRASYAHLGTANAVYNGGSNLRLEIELKHGVEIQIDQLTDCTLTIDDDGCVHGCTYRIAIEDWNDHDYNDYVITVVVTNPDSCDCTHGGTIAPPLGSGYINFINGNTEDKNNRATLNFDVFELVKGSPVKATEVYGFEVETWAPNDQSRQVFIEVKTADDFVRSPMFHSSSTANSSRIWAIMEHGNTPDKGGRTQRHTLRYMNTYGGDPKDASNIVALAPFLSSEKINTFEVKIVAVDDRSSVVTKIILLDKNGKPLGVTMYSTLDAHGEWSKFSTHMGVADIVFVIDTTGSMSSLLNNIRPNIRTFTEALLFEHNIDARYSLVEVKDIGYDGLHTTKASEWCSDIAAFNDKVTAIRATGGRNMPVSVVDAFEMARRSAFRKCANRFFVLMTDMGFQTENRYGIKDMQEMIDLLISDQVVVSVVALSSTESTHRDLYTKTKGLFETLNTTSGSLLQRIAELVREAPHDCE